MSFLYSITILNLYDFKYFDFCLPKYCLRKNGIQMSFDCSDITIYFVLIEIDYMFVFLLRIIDY
jgi:hypothetical protein